MHLLIFPFVAIGLTTKIINKRYKSKYKTITNNITQTDLDFNNIVKALNDQSSSEILWESSQDATSEQVSQKGGTKVKNR